MRARARAARVAACQGGARAVVRGHVHNLVAQPEEVLARERLREEVGQVGVSAYERHDDALILNQLADEEVAPFDVLDPVMVLRVVREVARACVVRGELGWGPRREPQLREEVGEEDCLLRGLAERHDLGLARRQRDGRLLLAPPTDRGLGVREDVVE
jgi:hypothetical protein